MMKSSHTRFVFVKKIIYRILFRPKTVSKLTRAGLITKTVRNRKVSYKAVLKQCKRCEK